MQKLLCVFAFSLLATVSTVGLVGCTPPPPPADNTESGAPADTSNTTGTMDMDEGTSNTTGY